MQDDTTKKTTVEDQELADMIANLNGATPTSAPMGAPLPAPAPAPNPISALPPLPQSPVSMPSPVDPVPVSVPTENSNFDIPEPTPGLPPLPTVGTPLPSASQPNVDAVEKFEPPVQASTLPPLGHKTPLPPLPGEEPEEDPDSDIDAIGADFPDPSDRSRKSIKVSSKRKLNDLSAIKQDALDKLRPLVDELDLPPKEKFDTLLLLIRSNDDKSLIPQAYNAADQIEDETSRAAALLDVVKEIDYFENPQN